MSDEPAVRAHLGKVLIPYCDSQDGWTDDAYTPQAARELAAHLLQLADQADNQLDQIAAACGDGHQWGDGHNLPWGEKATAYHCQREGCDGRKQEPGWLPFEPKQHLVPLRPAPVDCTGPGCDHCSDEALAEHIRKLWDEADLSISRAGVAWPAASQAQAATGGQT